VCLSVFPTAALFQALTSRCLKFLSVLNVVSEAPLRVVLEKLWSAWSSLLLVPTDVIGRASGRASRAGDLTALRVESKLSAWFENWLTMDCRI
jgi:hypothetical protein